LALLHAIGHTRMGKESNKYSQEIRPSLVSHSLMWQIVGQAIRPYFPFQRARYSVGENTLTPFRIDSGIYALMRRYRGMMIWKFPLQCMRLIRYSMPS